MPRRSTRLQSRNEEQKDIEMEIDEAEPTITNSNKRGKKAKLTQKTPQTESVSNDISENHDDHGDDDENRIKTTDFQIEQKEQSQSLSAESSVDVTNDVRRLSIDPNTVLPPMLRNDNDIEMENIEEEPSQNPDNDDTEYLPDDEPGKTLAQTRTRRNNNRISYKDESSDDDMNSDSDDNDPLFIGLTKAERAELRSKMDGIQSSYTDSVRKERELKLQEIICSFDFNIGAKVTVEEAGFIYDFSQKHQFDINDKIEDEGDFFLCSMREMMEEKMKLVQAGIRTKRNHTKRRGNDSDSEFDCDEYDDSESEYDVDSDWDNPDIDNVNMISDDEELFGTQGRKKRRRNKNVYIDKDGREYRCAGRLLLDDALKDTENFEGWSAARVQAWKNKTVNPNAYYYRFNDPGVSQKNGRIGMDEHKTFMERVMECGVNMHWGTFSMKIPGRVGYQCSNYWRQMMKDGWVKDPNYWIRSDRSFQFKRAKKGSIPDTVRQYSFVVIKDPSKVFDPLPGHHPKRPSDKTLGKYLQTNVKELTQKQKKGGKRKGNKSKNKSEDKENENENSNSKEEVEEEQKKDEKENENSNNGEIVEGKKKKKDKKKSKKKRKKKKSKKKKKGEKEEGEDAVNDEEGGESEEGKKTKKKKKKKKKSKKDKKEKKKDKKKKKKDKKAKKSKKKDGETETETETGTETEGEKETSVDSNGRNKKRKRDEDGEVSEHEPPQKKRKVLKSPTNSDSSDSDGANKENECVLSVLGDIVDIMTGEQLVNPAMSPYGHVMEYNSWCAILRNPLTKNKCPFTQKALTRRSLIKLNEGNIEEHKDKIVNLTDDDMQKLKKTDV